ncbi:hypothetical protein HY636_04820 [Candidatus Woesearchaeota archaeon]|nr:hypothetical protein [Candidatus Woesearchaeota archaeon]
MQTKNNLVRKIMSGVSGLALLVSLKSCAPSLTVPTQVPGSNGYVATGKDCCKNLGCGNYDGCKSEGEKYNPQTGIYEETCSCYDKSTPSSDVPHQLHGKDY